MRGPHYSHGRQAPNYRRALEAVATPAPQDESTSRLCAAAILELRPTVSADLVEFWSLVAFGSATAVKKRYGVRPRIQDRITAASELADRLHGRAVQAVEIAERSEGPCFILPDGTGIAIK
jgi:hypothetical protein